MRIIDNLSAILMFLGGLGLFMYGVQTTSDAIQKLAAHRFKRILQSLTKRRVYALISGAIMTVAFQSSTATTVLVVEFVNAGMISLAQALGIVLGSAVGTSITIQLIAFKFLDVALGAIFVGFTFSILGRKQGKHLGQALIGFGLIFVGMANMSNASAPLNGIPEVYTFLSRLGEEPFLAIVVGLILTTVIQSSTAVFAIMMSLAGEQLLGLSAIVPLVLGAHIGGTVTTLLSSLTAKKMDAKRTAIANTGYKVVAAILIYPFLGQFAQIVRWTTSDLQRQVANAHLLFALFMVFIFFPFNNWIARGLKSLIPDRSHQDVFLKFRFIDEASLEVPAVALKQAWEEIQVMADLICEQMLQRISRVFQESKASAHTEVAESEVQVDWYYSSIMRFLSSLSQKGLTEEQEDESIKMQFILKELEHIGDTFFAIVQLFEKLDQENMNFPKMEWSNLKELYEQVTSQLTTTLQDLQNWDRQRAGEVIRERPEIIRLQRSLQFHALAQSRGMNVEETGNQDEEKLRYVELDLIDLIFTIEDHTVNISQVILGII